MGDVTRMLAFILSIAILLGYISCDKECPSSDNESVLRHGHLYIYQYKSEAFAESVGTTDDRSRMILECNVAVAHQYECFFELKLKSCTLNAIGGKPDDETAWISNKNMKDLSRYPVVFSIHHGEIKDLYSNPYDSITNVNIKRGILSAFIFKLSMASEAYTGSVTDIHGTCPLESVVVGDGIFKTSKDMSNCAFPSRPDWQFSPWSLFWNMSFIHYQMNSTVNCEYKMENSVKSLKEVYCHERHAIGLESTHRTTTAVQTNIYYHMSLVREERVPSQSAADTSGRHGGIQFVYEDTPEPTSESQPELFLEKAKKMLFNLVQNSKEEMQLLTIPMFTDFVAWLRTAYDILPLLESIKRDPDFNFEVTGNDLVKDLSMSFLSDALVQCQTVPCFEAVSYLAIKGELSDSYLDLVLYSWTQMHFTKPKIIDYVKNICHHRNTRFCWLSLGSVVKQYVLSAGSENVKEVENVVHYFASNIGTACNQPLSKKEHEKLLTNLKAIGNIGKAFWIHSRMTAYDFMECIDKTHLPLYIRISALEVFNHLDMCDDDVMNYCMPTALYLTELLKNESENRNLRVAAYDQLIHRPQAYSLEKDLMQVLKNEQNSQILSYIASDLRNRLDDRDYQKANSKFVHTMRRLLEQEDIQLESLQLLNERNSYNEVYGQFFDVKYLPQNLRGFGAQSHESNFFPINYMIPEHTRVDVTLKLFNKVIELFTVDGKIQGWQEAAMNILESFHENSDDAYAELIAIFVNTFQERNLKFQPHSNETIVQSIRHIYETFVKNKHSEYPFLHFNFQMLGNTLNFLTFEDILGYTDIPNMLPLSDIQKLMDGVTYNNTRVIRVIEAYYQVPTMMGLALNWTTNATLGFSLRSGMILDLKQYPDDSIDIGVEGYFKPSAALTFLNRMVLDYPMITQIGIQANSSAFTSTEIKGEIMYSDDVKSLNIHFPQKPQKFLQLFRTNQIIKHNQYTELQDWDIDRTSVDWCLGKAFSAVTGFELCHERSYPNVTHRIKPWALMAGSCKWSLVLNQHDRKLRYYRFEYNRIRRNTHGNEFHVQFSTPGSSLRRVVNINVLDNSIDKFEGNVAIPELPDFYFSFVHKIPQHANHQSQLTDINLKFSDNLEYQLVYQRNQTDRTGTKEDSPSKTSKGKTSSSVQGRYFVLNTPFNSYKYSQEDETTSHSGKSLIQITYENSNPKWNFLSQILPATFWKSNSKASLTLRMNSKTSSKRESYHSEVITEGSVIDLKAERNTLSGQQHIGCSLTKTEKPSGKLQSFVNSFYDFESTKANAASSKEKHVFNITIPLRSWNLLVEKSSMDHRSLQSVLLTSAKMTPKSKTNPDALSYVGWWSDDAKHLFKLTQTEVKLKADIKTSHPTSTEAMEHFTNIPEYEIEGLQNYYINADLSIHYPTTMSDTEAVKFNGKFLLSSSADLFRFQKDFVLLSTYNNLQLDSHSVVSTKENSAIKQIFHNSYFTHTTSGTQAFYNMQFDQSSNENNCLEMNFNHNITSHVYNMASNVSYLCIAENEKQHRLLLNLDSDSPQWNMLNMQIRQIIEDYTLHNSRESMNFTSPFMKINVIATWDEDDHKKYAIFTSLPDNTPVMKISKHATGPYQDHIKAIGPTGENEFVYQRVLSDDFKKLKLDVFFPKSNMRALHAQGTILRPDYRIWRMEMHRGMLPLIDFLTRMTHNGVSAVTIVENDPDHPINKILHPALKTPLVQFIQELKTEMENNIQHIEKTLIEIVGSLQSFYESPVTISRNLVKLVSNQFWTLYTTAERKSIIIWAIKYFELPQLLSQQNIYNLLKSHLTLYDDDEDVESEFPLHTVLYRAGELVDWESFVSIPKLAKNRINKKFFTQNVGMENFRKKEGGSKIGLIFGPHHVYTFDGHLYAVPEYPSESCTYLLAHDIYASTFSIVTTSNAIHVLYPDVIVSVNSNDEVYINDNKKSEPLPYMSNNKILSITRQGSIIVIDCPTLTIFCQGKSFLCVFEITGWSGGGVIGLLGNADGELNNEYMLPNGQVSSDVLEFLRSYELSGNQECQNMKTLPDGPNASTLVRKQCKESVDKVCSFYNSLKQSFNEQCLIYGQEQNNICHSETALSTLCYYEQQPMESSCFEEKQENTRIQQKLQVVLILDQHESMLNGNPSSYNFRKSIERMMEKIQRQFEGQGYTDISYGLIGFGGDPTHLPSVHSIEGKIWVSHGEELSSLLRTLKFNGIKELDPLLAVQYAAEVLGHDTFNVKIFIAITEKDQLTDNKNRLHLVQSYLDKNHITLYTLASYPSIEKGKKVYGVRADGLVFPNKDDEEVFLDFPKGDLAKITAGTRGSLFLKKFIDPDGPSSFYLELAKEMFSKVRREYQYCRRCKSVRSQWWYYQSECHLVDCKT